MSTPSQCGMSLFHLIWIYIGIYTILYFHNESYKKEKKTKMELLSSAGEMAIIGVFIYIGIMESNC